MEQVIDPFPVSSDSVLADVCKDVEASRDTPKLPQKISDLTEEDKAKIMEDYANGIEHDRFDVHTYKNGKQAVRLRKSTPRKVVVHDRIVPTPLQNEPKTFMTDNQYILERLIALETTCTKLHQKNKKIKRKMKKLKNDIYVDVDEDSPDVIEHTKTLQAPVEEIQEEPEPIKEVPERHERAPVQFLRATKSNWRSALRH